jgi:hypothetical protein
MTSLTEVPLHANSQLALRGLIAAGCKPFELAENT